MADEFVGPPTYAADTALRDEEYPRVKRVLLSGIGESGRPLSDQDRNKFRQMVVDYEARYGVPEQDYKGGLREGTAPAYPVTTPEGLPPDRTTDIERVVGPANPQAKRSVVGKAPKPAPEFFPPTTGMLGAALDTVVHFEPSRAQYDEFLQNGGSGTFEDFKDRVYAERLQEAKRGRVMRPAGKGPNGEDVPEVRGEAYPIVRPEGLGQNQDLADRMLADYAETGGAAVAGMADAVAPGALDAIGDRQIGAIRDNHPLAHTVGNVAAFGVGPLGMATKATGRAVGEALPIATSRWISPSAGRLVAGAVENAAKPGGSLIMSPFVGGSLSVADQAIRNTVNGRDPREGTDQAFTQALLPSLAFGAFGAVGSKIHEGLLGDPNYQAVQRAGGKSDFFRGVNPGEDMGPTIRAAKDARMSPVQYESQRLAPDMYQAARQAQNEAITADAAHMVELEALPPAERYPEDAVKNLMQAHAGTFARNGKPLGVAVRRAQGQMRQYIDLLTDSRNVPADRLAPTPEDIVAHRTATDLLRNAGVPWDIPQDEARAMHPFGEFNNQPKYGGMWDSPPDEGGNVRIKGAASTLSPEEQLGVKRVEWALDRKRSASFDDWKTAHDIASGADPNWKGDPLKVAAKVRVDREMSRPNPEMQAALQNGSDFSPNAGGEWGGESVFAHPSRPGEMWSSLENTRPAEGGGSGEPTPEQLRAQRQAAVTRPGFEPTPNTGKASAWSPEREGVTPRESRDRMRELQSQYADGFNDVTTGGPIRTAKTRVGQDPTPPSLQMGRGPYTDEQLRSMGGVEFGGGEIPSLEELKLRMPSLILNDLETAERQGLPVKRLVRTVGNPEDIGAVGTETSPWTQLENEALIRDLHDQTRSGEHKTGLVNRALVNLESDLRAHRQAYPTTPDVAGMQESITLPNGSQKTLTGEGARMERAHQRLLENERRNDAMGLQKTKELTREPSQADLKALYHAGAETPDIDPYAVEAYKRTAEGQDVDLTRLEGLHGRDRLLGKERAPSGFVDVAKLGRGNLGAAHAYLHPAWNRVRLHFDPILSSLGSGFAYGVPGGALSPNEYERLRALFERKQPEKKAVSE